MVIDMIVDIRHAARMAKRKVSRQREWALRRQAKGCCPICGKDADGRFRCKKCRKKHAARQAQYRNTTK